MRIWHIWAVLLGLPALAAAIAVLSVMQWAERKAMRARREGFKDGYRYAWLVGEPREGVVETAARGYIAQQEGKAVSDAIR